jgi:NADH-quinone oxidoreductase subunit H
MTEYSGFRWALYFLGEYANMIVVAAIATTLFLGGWLRPFPNVPWMGFLDFVPPLAMLGVTGYCLYRIPKQVAWDQKLILAIFAGICFVITVPLAAALAPPLAGWKTPVHGGFWFVAKVMLYVYLFLWVRFTFPRYRFDQLMRLGWHHLIPLSIVNVMALAAALILHWQAGVNLVVALVLAFVVTLAVALWLVRAGERREQLARSTA